MSKDEAKKKPDITLQEFNVELIRWGKDEGGYKSKASYTTKGMDFTVELPKELSEAMVAVCRGYIAEASKEVLQKLTTITTKEQS